MKVLFNTYPMAFHTPGGGEVQLLQYKKCLSSIGIKVDLFNLWNPRLNDYDLMHYFSCIASSVHFINFCRKEGLPVFISPNLWMNEKTKTQYPFEEIHAQFLLADNIICNSDVECNLLSRVFSIPRYKFHRVYNGVEDRYFSPVDANIFRNNFNIREPFILNVANIEPRKNQLNLIKAMKYFPDLLLVLVGHERDNAYAQSCYKEGGRQVKMINFLPHESELLCSAYAACELFALPSLVETPGLAALEAAASGARVLITSEGCAFEYFGTGAIYVEPLDVLDISRGITKTLEQPRNLLRAHVKKHFTWKNTIKDLVDLYLQCQLFESVGIVHNGFYFVEHGEVDQYIWSKLHATLDCKSGIISFSWRSVRKAKVDIWLDGECIHQGVIVGSQWEPFTISINADSEKEYHRIELRIKNVFKPSDSDDRELGVAFKDVKTSESLV